MDTRRDFIKKSILLSGAAGLSAMLPASIAKALAIDPQLGSTFEDAEHVVILMQENRSFDHCFGMLKGVRGYNDPRTITLPDNNSVWAQTNPAGEVHIPFRLDIRNTKATWMGDLPHGRSSQVDAHNGGQYDRWLQAKESRYKEFKGMPLTMGYHTREDIPFNYALADAFTVCDQHFSGAMTSTWPNRLLMWSGTVRAKASATERAFIRNEMAFGELEWKTFPERLEENGIPWKIYQNDVTCGGGLEGEQRSWLTNFTCNTLEYFAQFRVKFTPRFLKSLQNQAATLPQEIKQLEEKLKTLSPSDAAVKKLQADLAKKREVLNNAHKELETWSEENFRKLTPFEKNLHQKAFASNTGDPDYQQLTTLSYKDGQEERTLQVPKGDVLHQFRQDVDKGRLPTVSWLVGPQKFSDHPSAPWYGAWYVSEVLDILTKNPEVWKKTIFILTYDENDGYYDHVPPFVAPNPENPHSGKCSEGVSAEGEYISRELELKYGIAEKEAREGPVGLGFRVPMVIASPWTRGGQVCSEVLEHTSILQFLEKFLSKKTGKDIQETNISSWRRTVSGDLTTAFNTYQGEKPALPFLRKDPLIEGIYNAKFKKDPGDFRPLTPAEIAAVNKGPFSSPLMPRQEKGIRPSCALPYELYADGKLSADKKEFELTLSAANEIFGERSAGSPFNVYLPGKYTGRTGVPESATSRSYAVAAGSRVTDNWAVSAFENGRYNLQAHGPNGFLRGFAGSIKDPGIVIACKYDKTSGNIALQLHNNAAAGVVLHIRDNAYKADPVKKAVKAGSTETIVIETGKQFNWYDFSVTAEGFDDFERRYAGRVETGKPGYSDPFMGEMI